MASTPGHRDLNTLYKELEQIKLENSRLKLELEISGMERELDRVQTSSTPRPRPKPFISNVQRSVNFNLSETQIPSCVSESDEEKTPNRFVTKRKSRLPVRDNDRKGTPSRPSVMMKPATYDGTGSWHDYKAHFDACAKINSWTEAEKGLYLAVSLRGQAQGVFGNLTSDTHNYEDLVQALQDRFLPPNQTELYRVQLRGRRQNAAESLSELAQDIRRLTNLAYPTAPSDVKETLAKEQFIDSLYSTDLRIRTKQARPMNLNDAVRHAVEIDAYYKAEKKHVNSSAFKQADIDKGQNDLSHQVENLTKTVQELQKEFLDFGKTSNTPKFGGQRQNAPGRFSRLNQKSQHNSRSSGHSKTSRPNQSSVKNTSGSGLYLPATIDNHNVDCLIDTGATLSLVSMRLWTLINGLSQALNIVNQDIVSASGTPLTTKGQGVVTLRINGSNYRMGVVVADIDTDIVLGLDFFKKYRCKINLETVSMTIQGKKSCLVANGPLGCQKVNSGRAGSIKTVSANRPNKSSSRKVHKSANPVPEVSPPTVCNIKHTKPCRAKRVNCEECGKSYKRMLYLRRHCKKTGHGQVESVPCDVYTKSTTDMGSVASNPVVPDHVSSISACDKDETCFVKTLSVSTENHSGKLQTITKMIDVGTQEFPEVVNIGVGSDCRLSRDTQSQTEEVEKLESQVQCSIDTEQINTMKECIECAKFKELMKCVHCGLYFEDQIMFYLHQGTHKTSGEPFTFNICGRDVDNKQLFFAHFTEGHGNAKSF